MHAQEVMQDYQRMQSSRLNGCVTDDNTPLWLQCSFYRSKRTLVMYQMTFTET